MIKTFRDSLTEKLYIGESVQGKVPQELVACVRRKLDLLNEAVVVGDLKVPPGNRLHALSGDRNGQWSISVNDQWRICFNFADGNAYDVEFCDYH
jgi:proteic killer suppression protein